MRLLRTPEFDLERRRYAFAFTCEACGHFDAAKGLCRHEYPTALHREDHYERPDATELVFCKEFELD